MKRCLPAVIALALVSSASGGRSHHGYVGTSRPVGRSQVAHVGKAFYAPAMPGRSWPFDYYRAITIDHTKCGDSDLSNFPVLVAVTDDSLKSVTNGGQITVNTGLDIAAYADPALRKPLAYELEKYNPATGEVVMWVKVLAVSHTSDTTFYIAYGDSAVYDPDAADFFSRITVMGSSISASTQYAVNQFVVRCKADGIWSQLKDVGLFVGDDLTAALVKLKTLSGDYNYANVNFVSGDYSEATGLAGDGETKYLKTGFAANALTANSTHIAVYNRSSIAAISAMGAYDDANHDFNLHYPWSDGFAESAQYNNQATQGAVQSDISNSKPFGFIVGSRTASDAHAIYRNGVQLASNTTSGGDLPSREVYILNNNGFPGQITHYTISFASYGDGLTATEVAKLSQRVNALQSALGRNVYGSSGVWDSDFAGVFHLGNGKTLNKLDSTSNTNLMSDHGSVSAGVGEIDGGAVFDPNSAQYISGPRDGSLNVTGTMITVSAWVNPNNFDDYHCLVSKWTAFDLRQYQIETAPDGTVTFGTFGPDATFLSSTSPLSAGNWSYVVGVMDGSGMRIYINATQDASNGITKTLGSTPSVFAIGALSHGSDLYDGMLDEVRISNVARSADWILTEFNNQSDPGSFYTVGSEITNPSASGH
jgi:hypothetical protein